MNDLISRLEAATGPDPELDEDIWTELRLGKGPNHQSLRAYTSSIDAALTLAPEGFQAYVDTGLGHGHDAHACVWSEYPHRIQGGAKQQATPAIALCIAAIKARAVLKERSAVTTGQREGQT